MATFNDLVRVIAEIEGMDPMTVRGIGIKVREAGMISKSGRGLSAARMTAEDAAALLIGVNATGMVKEAAEAVEGFHDLRLRHFPPSDETRDESDPIERCLKTGSPLRETLAALIFACIPQDGRVAYLDSYLGPEGSVLITFERPIRRANIMISGQTRKEKRSVKRYAHALFGSARWEQTSADSPDRRDTTTISERTLRVVGRALAT